MSCWFHSWKVIKTFKAGQEKLQCRKCKEVKYNTATAAYRETQEYNREELRREIAKHIGLRKSDYDRS